MPACVHGVRPLGACGICTPPELPVSEVDGPGGVPLNDAERRYLAMHARYESNRQDDVRYWDPDPQIRAETKRRWREIADWMHSDPWGPSTPAPNVRLGVVEDGRVTAWKAGEFTKNVRVIRDTYADMPVVECPDCGRPAPIGDTGYVRCSVIPPCLGGWRVLVVRVPES